MSGSRTITLTDREFHALVSAMALYEAEYEDDPTREQREDVRAHARVVEKWHAAGDAASPGRLRGTVTRWAPGTTAGFITGADGVSWFVSQNSTPDGGPLPVGCEVTFAGRPNPRPGKKYPEAFSVERVTP